MYSPTILLVNMSILWFELGYWHCGSMFKRTFLEFPSFQLRSIFCIYKPFVGSCSRLYAPFDCAVKPGVRYREVGEVISRHASSNGLSVVRVQSYSILDSEVYLTKDYYKLWNC